MTTLPSRISRIEPAIQSLLDQDERPEFVVLSLPRSCRKAPGADYVIPDAVAAWVAAGDVVVSWTDVDYGPATKLLGAIPHASGDVLLVADDDLVYAPFMVRELAATVRSTGHAASFCATPIRGFTIGQGSDGFAFSTALASFVADTVRDQLEQMPGMLAHDDCWFSYLAARERRDVLDLKPTLARYGRHLVYDIAHTIDQNRDVRQYTAVIRQALAEVETIAPPTLRMWRRRIVYSLRSRLRVARR